jgi:quercetin dioxygenase-like cupin family protein
MKAQSLAGAIALLGLTGGPCFATDYHPPFPPVIGIGGQTRLIYPDFPVELLVTEAESGGQFGMVVVYSQPNEGPDKNALLEYKLTETYYVLQGQYRFFLGDETFEGGPGTVIVAPPNVPHSFTNISDEVGKVLVIDTPVDGKRGTDFFVDWADQNTQSAESIAKINAAYGIDRGPK